MIAHWLLLTLLLVVVVVGPDTCTQPANDGERFGGWLKVSIEVVGAREMCVLAMRRHCGPTSEHSRAKLTRRG